jgi:hypothetical protein
MHVRQRLGMWHLRPDILSVGNRALVRKTGVRSDRHAGHRHRVLSQGALSRRDRPL